MSEQSSPNGHRPAVSDTSHGAPTRRQMVRYQFFKVDPAWRGLAPEVQEEGRRALEEAVTGFAGRMLIRAYSTVGTRGDVDFLLWQVSTDLEPFGQLSTAIYSTPMGPYLSTPYAYLAMTRRSIYEIPEESESGTNRSLTIQPGQDKYLFIYPFVKTRAWYALPFEERQAMINQHIVVGRKFPSVKLNTTYSFGLDDQEFVVAFETDEAGDFLDLVMALRETRASEFTLRDVPIFSCVSTSLRGALEALGTNGAWALPSHQSMASTVTAPGRQAQVDANGWAEVAAGDDLAVGGRLVVSLQRPDRVVQAGRRLVRDQQPLLARARPARRWSRGRVRGHLPLARWPLRPGHRPRPRRPGNGRRAGLRRPRRCGARAGAAEGG